MKEREYQLIDSGSGEKLEKFGPYTLVRPASQAIWRPNEPTAWKSANASFSRQGEEGWRGKLPNSWKICLAGLNFQLSPTPFGHLGLFPEQAPFWARVQKMKWTPGSRLLNLFGYSGAMSLAAAKAGAAVCHVDASRGMVDWAHQNAKLNGLSEAPIRWIVDDALKFVRREVRRSMRYDAIVLDPPTFGRGNRGEVFKIERDLPELLVLCRQLLSEQPKFVLLSCHTPGWTPIGLSHLLAETVQGLPGEIDMGEMQLGEERPLPSGAFARWTSRAVATPE